MPTKMSNYATVERARTAPMKEAFIKAYKLKPYKFSVSNLRHLLMQGDAGNDAVKRVLNESFGARGGSYIRAYGKDNVFDHYEFYGRSRTPLFLIGHPYNVTVPPSDPYISAGAADTLKALRELGMCVRVLHKSHSWYGFGTAQVAVYHWPTVKRVCGDCPFFPLEIPA